MPRKRILMLSPEVPGFPGIGSQVREYFLIEALREKFDIVLVSCVHPGFEKYVGAIRDMVSEFHPIYPFEAETDKGSERKSEYVYILNHIFFEKPLWVRYLEPFRAGMREAIRGVLKNGVDFILVMQSHCADFLEGADGGGACRILDMHNLNFMIIRRQGEIAGTLTNRLLERIEAVKMKRYEKKVLRRFDRLLAVSKHDKDIISGMGIDRPVDEIPNGVDTEHFVPSRTAGLERPYSMVFTGAMGYSANIKAVLFFAYSIFPAIRKEYPDATFKIVGRDPSEEVKRLSNIDGIEVTGFVEDVRGHVLEASVFVVPLQVGGGTRIKVLEAMAMGKAIVSTSIGAEGVDAQPGSEILLADDEREFARSVSRLFKDEGLREKIGRAARAKAAERYDWRIIGAELRHILEQL